MKLICLDLDGTLLPHNSQDLEHFEPPFDGAVEFTHRLGKLGHVMIYTCRTNPEAMGVDRSPEELEPYVRKYLDQWKFHYDSIFMGCGKPAAHLYIDDRALDCRPAVFNAPDAKHRYLKMIVKQASYRLRD